MESLIQKERKIILDKLCSKYGFTLVKESYDKIMNGIFRSPLEFTYALYRAEGMDPELADTRLFQKVLTEVQEHWI
ncbi:MAG: hypothetical protein LBR25_07665 [Erysipelotrichaceae bacterium]|jgi:hypothetical protein|nr:hypothetical protein [Erysipelotrichaceae bacterium]